MLRKSNFGFAELHRRAIDQHMPGTGRLLQPCRNMRRRPECQEIAPDRADAGPVHHDPAGGDANAAIEREPAPLGQHFADPDRRIHGVRCGILSGDRISEIGLEAIAGIAGERTVELVDDRLAAVDIALHQPHDFLGVEFIDQPRGIDDVDMEHRHLAPFSCLLTFHST
jgi:hypothetical protein